MKSFVYTMLMAMLASALFVSSCAGKKDKIQPTDVPKAPPPPTVDAHIVQQMVLGETLELPGNIVAGEETAIQPEISGRLTSLNIPEGKTVGQGTLLATIYDGDLRAQLNKLRKQLEVQQQRVQRYEALLKIDGVSKQEYDLINLETENIRADIRIIETDLQRTQIRAPFTGQLGLKMVSSGAYVSPATVITNIRKTNDLRVDFSLPEKYTSRLGVGATVSFTSEGNDKVYTARVMARESGITETDRNLKLRAMVTNNDGTLLPGGFVKIKLDFEPDPNAIMVPSQAILPQARTKQVVKVNGGVVSFVDVELGLRDSARIQILSGLQPGDTIVTTGLMRLKPNDKVKIGKLIP
ncbi:MAG TPA: efflux RND transporter periplasmic adaptor subunit [Ferruginibacter sp.]|nr:efflux RND transporter periplasmic adaptor subunit [Ferruginibacter sp.]HRN90987.1 efflux RND transporter periplasmic adaptor subunit [Ferruginibacter sp.]HRO05266.1 efflux RND transporter periplasmic adaptor subunit [Ferruginibacter sp.]HRO96029.1 efflux RND transporter periplasmic adaptor subunit [Ferruginibacter sp.]HRP48638.1 efflux RND transporter periplasmic adaptor subunit [Ferruginibacter sp.]